MKSKFYERGFTLLELMAAMVILAGLTAIVVPKTSGIKKKGFDRQAQVDLRLVAAAEEAYFERYDTYKACNEVTCYTALEGLQQLNPGVKLEITTATGADFQGTSYHLKGTGEIFKWN